MKTEGMKVPVQVVKKALAALDFLVEQDCAGGATLGQIAGRMGIRTTTAHNILKTMEMCGYVGRAEARLYRLGVKCMDFARGGDRMSCMVKAGSRILSDMARESGESFVLTTLIAGNRRVLCRAQGSHPVVVNPEALRVNGAASFYDTVTARVMLAHAQPGEADAVVACHGLPMRAWGNIASRKRLDAELNRIRRAGMAGDRPGPGVVSMAVPVQDHAGNLMGAVGCYVPLSRWNRRKRDEILRMLKKAGMETGLEAPCATT